MENRKDKFIAAVMGLVVGDALGVPVEFISRERLRKQPVTDMLGYGTHCQPAGTWSDDSSMVIATVEWLAESREKDLSYRSLMDKFIRWLMNGEYTPYGENFDCGISTSKAIIAYGKGAEPFECGGKAACENGNGALMRILPAALYFNKGLAFECTENAKYIYDICSLTHAHIRSKMGCLIYSKIVADMLNMPEMSKFEVVNSSLELFKEYVKSENTLEYVKELDFYSRIFDLESFVKLSEEEIKSSGYVVDTLEAALWCFLNTNTYKECVLKAVNLGDDTDTVGAVAGGLAGLYYGYENIPREWLQLIPKRDMIEKLTEKMCESLKED